MCMQTISCPFSRLNITPTRHASDSKVRSRALRKRKRGVQDQQEVSHKHKKQVMLCLMKVYRVDFLSYVGMDIIMWHLAGRYNYWYQNRDHYNGTDHLSETHDWGRDGRFISWAGIGFINVLFVSIPNCSFSIHTVCVGANLYIWLRIASSMSIPILGG